MSKSRINSIKTVLMGLLVITGSIVPSEAGARYRPNQMRQIQAYQIGERNGYELGLREAREDRRRNKRYDETLNFSPRDSRWGFLSQYRFEDDYRRGFRQGYASGYRVGFSSFRR